MTHYKRFTLQDLIDNLRTLGDSPVQGLEGIVHSYRGYYDRPSIEPVDFATPANILADQLEDEIGKLVHGWKGGDYTVDAGKPVYWAGPGSTGPSIIGLEPDDNDTYHVVTLAEDYYF